MSEEKTYIVMWKKECSTSDGPRWRGSVETPKGNVFFEESSDSPTSVLESIRKFLAENKNIRAVRLLRNGSPKWLGFHAISLDMSL